jgi:hypothetical protein
MKKQHFIANNCIALALALASSASAATTAISWNFDRSDPSGTVSGTSLAGVAPVANWNNSVTPGAWGTINLSDLIDSTGAATTLDLTCPVGIWGDGGASVQGTTPAMDADGTYNKRMLNNYVNNNVTNVSLTQIPYASYNIYIYFSSDTANREGSVTDATSTFYFRTIGPSSVSGSNATLTQATETSDLGTNALGNYALFSNLSGASKTVTVDIPDWGGIAGIQIVAIPEPSSAALGLLAAGGLLLRRRRA